MKNEKITVTTNDQVGIPFHSQLQKLVIIRISARFNRNSRLEYFGLVGERLQEFVAAFPRCIPVKLFAGEHLGRFIERIWRGEKNSVPESVTDGTIWSRALYQSRTHERIRVNNDARTTHHRRGDAVASLPLIRWPLLLD